MDSVRTWFSLSRCRHFVAALGWPQSVFHSPFHHGRSSDGSRSLRRDDADDRDKTICYSWHSPAAACAPPRMSFRHPKCGRRASIMPVVRRPQIGKRVGEMETQGEASPKRLGPHQGRHDGSSHPAGQGLNSRRRRLPNMQSSIRSHNRRRASVRRFRNSVRQLRRCL